ncbi:MAG: glycosyltransferase family 4 protein [Gemmatimonadales bacterium]
MATGSAPGRLGEQAAGEREPERHLSATRASSPVPPPDVGRLLVTHVVAPARSGGLETVVTSLAEGTAARGHAVQVVSLLGPDDSCEPFLRLPGSGVPVEEVRLPPRSYRREIAAVTEALIGSRTTLVHTHGFHGNLIGWRAARRAGVPVVATVHGYTGGGAKGRFYDWLDQRILTRFDGVVPVSSPLQAQLGAAGVPATRLTLIRNAKPGTRPPLSRAEARARLGLPAEGMIVGWVGRLSFEKAPDQFVKAMARLPDVWRGSVIGTGPMAVSLAEHASAQLANRITWHGSVPDAGSLLAAFDVVALTSRTEGTPMVVLEAMATGVPVVATRVGGVPDLLGEAEGVVVPPENADAMAEAIDRVRTDPGSAAERARRAAIKLEKEFGYPAWLDQYEQLYRRLARHL